MGLNFNTVSIWLSILTHFVIIVPTFYIVILCIQSGFSLFTWHPLCLSLGCGLLITEAVFAISGEALLGSRVSRSDRIKIHWILHVVGLILMVIGFAAIIANKIRTDGSHFATTHSIIGLITILVIFLVALGGLTTLFSGILPQQISLASIKLVHGCLGVIAVILIFVTLFTGMYKSWWPGSSFGRTISVIAYVVGLILVILKPTYTTLVRIRGIFN